MQVGAEEALQHDIHTLRRALRSEPPSPGSTEEPEEPVKPAARLEAALALNEEASRGWGALEAMLQVRLQRCRESLDSTRDALQQLATRPRRRVRRSTLAPSQLFNYRRCGMPYFRDGECGTPQSNTDTVSMRNKGVVNILLLRYSIGWARTDKACFLAQMLKISKQKACDKLYRQLDTLHKRDKPKNLEQQRQHIHDQVEQILTTASLTTDMCLNEEDYDWDHISRSLGSRHSLAVCKAMWNLFLHPALNRSAFTSEEHSALAALVLKYNHQDWERIARELSTGRSGYQCFIYFKSVMDKSHTCGVKWTPEEDDYLKSLVELCRHNDKIEWARVAYHFGNRTKIQIYNRWATSVRPQIRKGRFIPEEDAVLLACINKFGLDFSKALRFLPGRILPQVRARYNKHIAQNTTVSWSVEDDTKLLQLVENTYCVDSGKNFSEIVKHFPGKDRVTLRTRYLVLQRWMKKNPYVDLKYAPRRPPKLKRLVESLDLKTAVQNLVLKLEQTTCAAHTESDSRSPEPDMPSAKTKKLNVDGLLVNVFMREMVRIKYSSTLEEDHIFNDPLKVQELKEYTSNLRRVMLLLGARVDRKVFANSAFFAKFVHLLSKDEDNVNPNQIKTYSKHVNVIHHFAGQGPDSVSIWMDSRPLEAKYVLPPNYNTITACKSILLMLHKKKFKNKMVLSALDRPNYKMFLKRCQVLFFWPLLLSNYIPKLKTPLSKDVITKPSARVSQLSCSQGRLCEVFVTPFSQVLKKELGNNQQDVLSLLPSTTAKQTKINPLEPDIIKPGDKLDEPHEEISRIITGTSTLIDLIDLPLVSVKCPPKINLVQVQIIKPATKIDDTQLESSSLETATSETSSKASGGQRTEETNRALNFSIGLKTYARQTKEKEKKDENLLIMGNKVSEKSVLVGEEHGGS